MKTLRYASACSGIEAVSLAWDDLGMEPVFFADNAPFPTEFLNHRYPATPNLGNMLAIDGTKYAGMVDVFWASFPCQDFSEAGKRKGLDGDRGLLTLAGIKLVDEIEPPVFVFENVKGLLSDEHNAFGQFLGALVGEFGPLLPPGDRWSNAGYVLGPKRAIAWRLLDAQHFGLPQSRPRLYLVACPRGGIDPRRILLESREEGDTLGERAAGGPDALSGDVGSLVPEAYRVAIRGRKINGFEGQQIEQGNDIANCLRTAGGGGSIGLVLCKVDGRWDIRRMLPEECEALQGMPAGYSMIPGASATARYSAVGNSLAVPVVRWIGERIRRVMIPEAA
jgi:DNA (cytosine-5)-methyltransferase 1